MILESIAVGGMEYGARLAAGAQPLACISLLLVSTPFPSSPEIAETAIAVIE
jgi:hypothetical protein